MSRKSIYLAELIFNLNRFVDKDITSRPTEIVHAIPENCHIAQGITGEYTAVSALYAEPEVLTSFAAMYSKIELENYEEIVNELAADFLNLHNGLFLVNLSEAENVESSLTPPITGDKGETIELYKDTYVMPVDFNFGTVNFILSEK